MRPKKEQVSISERAERLVRQSIQDLLELHPFLGVLALTLVLVEDFSCDTAWTNGVAYGYNPYFIVSLTRRQRMGLSAHEVLHVLLQHAWRRKNRDPDLWNEAADYVINLILNEHGFELPDGGLLDPKYKGMPAEMVYRDLIKKIKDQLQKPQPQMTQPEEGDDNEDGSSGQPQSTKGKQDGKPEKSESGDNQQDGEGDEGQGQDGKPKKGGKAGKGQQQGADGDDDSSGASAGDSSGDQPGDESGESADNGEGQDDKDGDKASQSENSKPTPGRKPGEVPKPRKPGLWGEVRDAPANVSPAQLSATWAVAAERARMVARARGNMPGQFEKLVEAAKASEVDWREQLWHLVEECCSRNDYSWENSDEEYMQRGLYVPTLGGKQIGPMVFSKDTSASCDEDVARYTPAEVEALNDTLEPEVLYVVDADTRVTKVHEVQPGDKIPASTCGGGGTDYRPVFEWVEKQGIQPAVLIYMGDMQAVFPEKEPDYEVIWLMTAHTEPAVPWGRRVRLPL